MNIDKEDLEMLRSQKTMVEVTKHQMKMRFIFSYIEYRISDGDLKNVENATTLQKICSSHYGKVGQPLHLSPSCEISLEQPMNEIIKQVEMYINKGE